VRRHERVVEVVLADAERQAAAHDLAPPLELVERHVDTPAGPLRERDLDPLARHQRAQVAQLAPDAAQEARVRAGRPAVDERLDRRRE
jgi:hypothetical protein